VKSKLKTISAVLVILCLPLAAFALDESATVRVVTLLKTSESWNGAPIVYPEGKAEVTALSIEIAPGGETGWHRHGVPSFAMLLEGTLEVTLRDGRVKRLQAGDALAEVVDTAHNGRNVGLTPARLVVFYAGAAGLPLTGKEP
jgi:quercetin dioxygenase-like cupin family protein